MALLTRMDQPLGRAIGNAVETEEAIAVLRGEGPADLVEVTLALGAEMLVLGGKARNTRTARATLEARIADRSGLARLREIVEAQGGDSRAVDDPSRLPKATLAVPIPSRKTGFVRSIDARGLGLCAMSLGAGRRRAEDRVDPAVGILLDKKVGDRVQRGEALAWLHAQRAENLAPVVESVRAAYRFSPRRVRAPALVLERVR